MGIRRTAREWALQFLFQSEFNPSPTLEEGFQHFWEERGREAEAEEEKARRMGRPEPKPAEKKQAAKEVRKARRFAEETVRGVLEHWREIDECLGKHCENWAVDRMGVVDRNVMRIAAYEMMFREDIPPVVSINEAVDLAKMYSSVESGRFVNGVLDRVRKELPRDARVGADRRKEEKTTTPQGEGDETTKRRNDEPMDGAEATEE